MSSLRLARLVPALALVLWAVASFAPRPAAAAETAKAYFDSGVRKYNLGHFQDAIADFEKAYNIDPAPILLFNIAQSHRQLGEKERALFFYRRYLEQAPNAGNKGEVEQRMKDLSQSLQQEKDLKQKPPPGVETKDLPPPKPPEEVVTKIVVPPPPAEEGPRRWQADAFLAPSFIGFSGQQIDSPVMLAFRVGGSYALLSGPSTLRLGAEALGALLPFTNLTSAAKENSSLWGLMLTARYSFLATPELAIGGGAGVGVIWWAGLHEGNPFTVDHVAADAPIPMPSFQIGLRAEYALGHAAFVALSPELVLSKTTSDGLSRSVSSVHRLDIYAGAGYRF